MLTLHKRWVMNMDPLYKSFVAVVEGKTMMRAAQRLHVAQPTLSRQIAQLEEQMGIPLFDRVGKRLVLNHAGTLVYEVAKRSLAMEDRLKAHLDSIADPEVGTIHIGAGLTPAIHLLPPMIATYRLQHPGVQFSVRIGSSREMLTALRSREVDMAIVTTVGRDETGFWTLPLMKDPLLLVASVSMAAAVGDEPISISQLAEYPMVLLREGSGLRELILDLAMQHHTSLHVAAETDSLESISSMVQHGVGLSILPTSAVHDDIQQERISALSVKEDLPAREILLVREEQRSQSAVSAKFVDAVITRRSARQDSTPLET